MQNRARSIVCIVFVTFFFVLGHLPNYRVPNFKFGTHMWNPNLAPKFESQMWPQILGIQICNLNLSTIMLGSQIWVPDLGTQIWIPHLGPKRGSQIWVPNLGTQLWMPNLSTQIRVPKVRPKFGCQMWVPKFRTQIWDPGPKLGSGTSRAPRM